MCTTVALVRAMVLCSRMRIESIYRGIGALIRAKRREHEFSQDSLGRKVGLSRAAIASIESGRQRLLVHHLCLIARALKSELPELMPSLNAGGPDVEELQFSASLSSEQKGQIAELLGVFSSTSARTPHVKRRRSSGSAGK